MVLRSSMTGMENLWNECKENSLTRQRWFDDTSSAKLWERVERLSVHCNALKLLWYPVVLPNCSAEIEKFAPSLKALVVHPSAMAREEMMQITSDTLVSTDLVITSYGSLLRFPSGTRIGPALRPTTPNRYRA
jgi:hypothetical protein